MKNLSNQKGFGLVLVVVLVAVIGVIGVVGYRLANTPETNPAVSQDPLTSSKAPAEIKTRADLQKATTAVDNTPVDKGVDPAQLDSDLNALL